MARSYVLFFKGSYSIAILFFLIFNIIKLIFPLQTECSGNGECDCLLRQRCRCDVGYDGEYCQNCRVSIFIK